MARPYVRRKRGDVWAGAGPGRGASSGLRRPGVAPREGARHEARAEAPRRRGLRKPRGAHPGHGSGPGKGRGILEFQGGRAWNDIGERPRLSVASRFHSVVKCGRPEREGKSWRWTTGAVDT